MRKNLLLAVLMLSAALAWAQDPHFSQFYASPLTLNPALTGVFSCNYRFTAIYRSQWSSVLHSNQYDREGTPNFRTYSASFDLRTRRAFADKDAFGIGVYALSDRAGAADFGTNGAGFSFSYIKSLNWKGTHFLVAGLNANVFQRTINSSKLCFGTNYDGTGCNPLLPQDPILLNGFDDNFLYYDGAAGLLWFLAPDRSHNYFIGAALHHINRPNQSFQRNNATYTAVVPMKIVLHAGMKLPLSDQLHILPKVAYTKQSKQWETNIGAELKWFFNYRDPDGPAVYGGLNYRLVGGDNQESWVDQRVNSQALIYSLRVDMNDFSIMAAYDMDLGEVSRASRTIGGFELAGSYIGCFSKHKAKTIVCPRF